MSQQAGAGILNSLKNKMQHLRDELEKYKDLYEEKCQDIEEERSKKQEVGVALVYIGSSLHFTIAQSGNHGIHSPCGLSSPQ